MDDEIEAQPWHVREHGKFYPVHQFKGHVEGVVEAAILQVKVQPEKIFRNNLQFRAKPQPVEVSRGNPSKLIPSQQTSNHWQGPKTKTSKNLRTQKTRRKTNATC